MNFYTKAERARNSIIARLRGSDTCPAAGITVRGTTPVLALCRELLGAGLDPDTALEVHRAGILALRVRTIGEASRLEINGHGNGFRVLPAGGTAAPIRQNAPGAIRG